MLFKNVQSSKLDPKKLITHHFNLNQIIEAYDTFEQSDFCIFKTIHKKNKKMKK